MKGKWGQDFWGYMEPCNGHVLPLFLLRTHGDSSCLFLLCGPRLGVDQGNLDLGGAEVGITLKEYPMFSKTLPPLT